MIDLTAAPACVARGDAAQRALEQWTRRSRERALPPEQRPLWPVDGPDGPIYAGDLVWFAPPLPSGVECWLPCKVSAERCSLTSRVLVICIHNSMQAFWTSATRVRRRYAGEVAPGTPREPR